MIFVFRSASGALIVYDITNRSSFQSVIQWLDEVNSTACANGMVCLLVGHKTDLSLSREVSMKEAQAFAIEHKMEFIETSAKTRDCVDEAFKKISTRIYNDISNDKIQIKDGWDGVKIGRHQIPIEEISITKPHLTQQTTTSPDSCAC